MVKGKLLQSETIYAFHVKLRISCDQYQRQNVYDNTSSRTQKIEIELWCFERPFILTLF